MICYCMSLPHYIALVTLCTLLLWHQCHHIIAQATQQSTYSIGEPAIRGVSPAPTKTTEQICSNKMLKNASLCKPCTCDHMGSESPDCDSLTRRCTCRPGYTGSKCNKCSHGYFNSSTQGDLGASGENERGHAIPTMSHWQCQTCGPCFFGWQEKLLTLKERSVDSIKRASELEANFMDRIALDPTTKRLALSGNESSLFKSLDDQIRIIGDKILENKQASDQIRLLSGELNLTATTLNETDKEAAGQLLDYAKLKSRLVNLGHDINLQVDFHGGHLSRALINLDEEILGIKQFIPEQAIRLIRAERNRTAIALARILDHHQGSSPVLEKLLSNLVRMLDEVKYSHRQMHYIGTQILNERLSAHPSLMTDLAGPHKTELLRILEDDQLEPSSSEATTALVQSAQDITELDIQLFDLYQANTDNRTAELGVTRRQIEEAKASLHRASQLMSTFGANITAINRIAESINGTGECNYSQLVENATQIVRASLDEIDVRWPKAQVELAELTLRAQALNETIKQQFLNLTIEINKALGEQLPYLGAFREATLANEDFLVVNNLSDRTKLMAVSLNDLGEKLTGFVSLRDTLADLSNQTRILNANALAQSELIHETPNDNQRSTRQKHDTGPLNSLRSTSRALSLDSRSALDRVRNHHARSIGRKITTQRVLAEKIDQLTSSTDENRRLSQEIGETLAELSVGSLIIEGTGGRASDESRAPVVLNSTRLAKLHDRRRLMDVATDIRQISIKLHQGLFQTRNLSAEFDEYERVFARQREQIDSLHRTMDVINIDLKKKSEFYENCQTS